MPFKTAARIQHNLRIKKKKAVTVDVDDTLVGTIFLIIKSALAAGYPNPARLSAEEMYAKYRHGRIPGWSDGCYTKIMLENEFDRDVEALPRAKETLEAILEYGIEIACYLTARAEQIRPRTVEMLARLGFPERPVIMRPKNMPYEATHAWKAEILKSMQPEVVAHIDDHPDVASLTRAGFQGKLYVFGLEHSSCEVVIGCPTWEHVWENIQKHHLK